MYQRLLDIGWTKTLLAAAEKEKFAEDMLPSNVALQTAVLDFLTGRGAIFDECSLLYSTKPLRSFNCYVEGAFKVSNDLANTLLALTSYIVVKTVEPDAHYDVLVGGRPIAAVRDLERLMRREFLTPYEAKYERWKLHVLPPDVYMIDYYHRLCDPRQHDEWPRVRETLRLLDRAEEVGHVINGGQLDLSGLPGIDEVTNYVRMAIVTKFLAGEGRGNFVLAGRLTMPLVYGGTFAYTDGMPQLIAKLHINDCANMLRGFIEQNPQLRMHVIGVELSVPFDFRMRKYVIYLNYITGSQQIDDQRNGNSSQVDNQNSNKSKKGGGREDKKNSQNGNNRQVDRQQRPLLEIFTSAQYELVPYVELADTNPKLVGAPFEGSIQIAHPYVTLRLEYIGIWIIRIMQQNGKGNADAIKHLMQKKLDTIAKLKEKISKSSSGMTANSLAVSWFGIWSDPEIDYKIVALKRRREAQIPTYPYKPYVYYKQHQELREVV